MRTTANPTMLMLARESRALTQTAFARQIGIAQGTISKVEHGTIAAADELVARYAATLRYPRSLFFEDLEARELPVTFYRKKNIRAVGAIEQRAIDAAVNFVRLRVRKLLKSVDVPPNRVPFVNADSHGGPERVARELRLGWSVPRGPVENLTKLLEDMGVLVVPCDFGTPHVDGLSIYDPRDHIPPIIAMNRAVPGERYRFTIAHELAHIVMHHHQSIPPPQSEDEANSFAAEFLTPSSDIKPFFQTKVTPQTLFAMKPHWKVSAQSLLMRARELGRLTEGQENYLYMKMAPYRTREPNPVPIEQPSLFTELVNCHLHSLGYADNELADVLGLEPDEFRAMYIGDKPVLRLLK